MDRKFVCRVGTCVLGLVIAAAWTPATARANQAANSPTTAPSSEAHRHPLARLEAMLEKLNLTASQQTQVNSILANAKSQLEAAVQQAKSSGNREGLREQVRTILKNTRQQILAALTPQQKAQLRAMMKNHQSGQN